jgi:hypothetical protein
LTEGVLPAFIEDRRSQREAEGLKKKLPAWVCVFITVMVLLPFAVYADVGPKPSVVIDFKGLENERYYVTLLSEIPDTGPYSAIDAHPGNQRFHEGDADYEIWKAFSAYQDADSYYFLQYFKECTVTSRFTWGYYPPPKFKILIYFPDENRFLASKETFERYAFDSYFTAAVQSPDIQSPNPAAAGISVVKSYDHTKEILSFAVRTAVTIAIEMLIALLFGLRQKSILRFIAAVNLITQSVLNVLLNLTLYYYGGMMYVLNYIWMELLVFAIEAAAYAIGFNKIHGEAGIRRWIAPVYALCANGVSFMAGMLISFYWPGIF